MLFRSRKLGRVLVLVLVLVLVWRTHPLRVSQVSKIRLVLGYWRSVGYLL